MITTTDSKSSFIRAKETADVYLHTRFFAEGRQDQLEGNFYEPEYDRTSQHQPYSHPSHLDLIPSHRYRGRCETEIFYKTYRFLSPAVHSTGEESFLL